MTDAWQLTVDIPASDLVRRRGKIVRRTLGIPALHNLRDWTLRNSLTKLHKAQLDAGLTAELQRQAWVLRQQLCYVTAAYDVLLIRRAPRPLDCAIQSETPWKAGGRGIYGDNLGSALKPGRDWTAKLVFGLDGDSSPLLRWHVGQERSGKAKLYQLSVIIVPAEDCECCGLPRLPARWLRGDSRQCQKT